MTSKVEERLAHAGITLPACPVPVASYVPARKVGGLIYASGQCSIVDGALLYGGKLGRDVSDEDGYQSARIAAVRCISAMAAVADLDKLSIVKVNGSVNSYGDYSNQASVVNGASELLLLAFGEKGKHARAALGVAALPLNASVEIEIIAALDE